MRKPEERSTVSTSTHAPTLEVRVEEFVCRCKASEVEARSASSTPTQPPHLSVIMSSRVWFMVDDVGVRVESVVRAESVSALPCSFRVKGVPSPRSAEASSVQTTAASRIASSGDTLRLGFGVWGLGRGV